MISNQDYGLHYLIILVELGMFRDVLVEEELEYASLVP